MFIPVLVSPFGLTVLLCYRTMVTGWVVMGTWQTDEQIYDFMYEVMYRWRMDVYG